MSCFTNYIKVSLAFDVIVRERILMLCCFCGFVSCLRVCCLCEFVKLGICLGQASFDKLKFERLTS